MGRAISARHPWIFIKGNANQLAFDGRELLIPHPEGYSNLGHKMVAMFENFLHSSHSRLFRIDDDVNIAPDRLEEVIESCEGWDYTGVNFGLFEISATQDLIAQLARRMPEQQPRDVARKMAIYLEPGRNPVSYAIGAFMSLSRQGAGRLYPKVLEYHDHIILDDMMVGQALIDTDCTGLRIGENPIVELHVKREVR